jgi:hypothetical protein
MVTVPIASPMPLKQSADGAATRQLSCRPTEEPPQVSLARYGLLARPPMSANYDSGRTIQKVLNPENSMNRYRPFFTTDSSL